MTRLRCCWLTFSVILLFIVTGCSHRQKKREASIPTQEINAQPQKPQSQRREANRPKRTRQKVQAPRKALRERKTVTKQQPVPEQQPLTEWGEEE